VTEVGYYAASAGSYRSQMPAFANLLKDPKKPNEEYAVFPPVLFTNYEVVKTELFGSAALLKVHHFNTISLNHAHISPDRS
jgi:hypothetical protein